MSKSSPLSRQLISQSPNLLISLFLLLLSAPVRAVSTHNFAGCGFPDTGQTICYNGTDAIPCPASGSDYYGQDGTYSAASSSPSFTVYAGLVTMDNRTGLMWESTGSNNGNYSSWANAVAVCEGSTFAGYTDWRLPNIRELMSIMDYGYTRLNSPVVNATAFPNTISGPYWSSTAVPGATDFWYANMADASVSEYNSAMSYTYVRCVRGGPGAGMIPAAAVSAHAFNSGMNCNGVWKLPDTSTRPYRAAVGDDSYYQPVASSPSYTNNGNGTTTDHVTGLMWVSNSGAVSYTWQAALSSCAVTMNSGSGYAGYKDWRLPNVKELMSIVDFGSANAPRINTIAFPGTQATYWTSTTYAQSYYINQAWTVIFQFGRVDRGSFKYTNNYMRCVRGP